MVNGSPQSTPVETVRRDEPGSRRRSVASPLIPGHHTVKTGVWPTRVSTLTLPEAAGYIETARIGCWLDWAESALRTLGSPM